MIKGVKFISACPDSCLIKSLITCLLICLTLILSACGGGGGGSGNGNENVAPIGDVTGDWNVSEVSDETACGDGIVKSFYGLSVSSQSGNSITVSTKVGVFTGNFSGNRLTWSGSFPESGGTSQSSTSLVVAPSCNSLSGTANWSWSDGVNSCSGTSTITATRDTPQGCGVTSVTIPNAPSGLFANVTSSSSINLSWNDNSNDETSFIVQRSLNSTSGYTSIATLNANSTSFINTGLSPVTTYYYRVIATNSAGNSANSNVANATTDNGSGTMVPVAPDRLFASSVGVSSANLVWTDNSNDEIGFRIERSTASASGPFSEIATPSANITGYRASLAAGTTYYFRVAAYNAIGISAYSNVKTLTAGDAAPVLTVPTSASSGVDFSVSWTYGWSSGGGLVSSQDGFDLQRSATSSTAGFTTVYTTRGLGDRAVSRTIVQNLSAGTYHYRVLANGSKWSSVVPITVSSLAPPTLRIVNDLFDRRSGTNDWAKWNKIIRVRIGVTENAVLNNFVGTEKLWPTDSAASNQTQALTYIIDPAYQQSTDYRDFDVRSFNSGNYWVFIQNGWWESFCTGLFCNWSKHMSQVVGCDGVSTVFKYSTFQVSGHTGGIFEVKASQFLPIGNWAGSLFCN